MSKSITKNQSKDKKPIKQSSKQKEKVEPEKITEDNNDLLIENAKMAVYNLRMLLSRGQTLSVLRILKNVKFQTNGNLLPIVENLMPFGNLLFYQYVKQEFRDFLNLLPTYDIILHALKPDEVIQLLHYNVIELEYANKINDINALTNTVYMFLQLADYNPTVKEYLFNKYSDILDETGLFNHLFMYNISHEILVYLKSCLANDLFNKKFVNFEKIVKTYQELEAKSAGSPLLGSRLINVINMIMDYMLYKGMSFPALFDFEMNFKQQYIINDADDIDYELLMNLSYETFLYLYGLYQYRRAILIYRDDTSLDGCDDYFNKDKIIVEIVNSEERIRNWI